jgi:hypothetical protein
LRVHLFGFEAAPPDAPASDASNRVIAFLTGEPVTLDATLADALRIEFAGQEQYRLTLVARLRDVVTQLTGQAAELAPQLETPYVAAQSYETGYRAGAYKTGSEAAQLVTDVLNMLAREMGG